MFRRLRNLLRGDRRYRDAAYARPNLASRTEAGFVERLRRALLRREIIAYDEREQRFGDGVRLAFVWIVSLAVLWFVARSALAWNLFSGN